MDLNSLFHSALKVAEITGYPQDKVCLVHDYVALEYVRVGVEFAESGLFVVLTEQGDVEVIVEMGTAAWIQPLDRMCGVYQNPRMAMAACAMIISGCDYMEKLDEVLCTKRHDQRIPDRHTVVTVVNNNPAQPVE